MTRLEENRAILEEMDRLSKANSVSTYEQMTTYQLRAITVALMDISKSLAVLADKSESEGER
jgi:uncharacterized protein YqfA (UPF0365 family)